MGFQNPWIAEIIQAFSFYCPECAFKSKHQDYFETHASENHVKSSEEMVSVPTKNSINNELIEVKTVTEYPEENYESTIEDFGVYETEVKEEIISEFDTDDIVNDPSGNFYL